MLVGIHAALEVQCQLQTVQVGLVTHVADLLDLAGLDQLFYSFSTINNIVVHLPLFSGTLYICLSCIHCTVSESFVRVTKPAISGGILYTLIPRI